MRAESPFHALIVRIIGLAASCLGVIVCGCRITDVPLWGPQAPIPVGACPVEKTANILYKDGEKVDVHRHSLDLYRPKNADGCPVVVVVHGGAWITGDNRACGLYTSVGDFLASQGVIAVLPNYRLTPQVKHPEHIKDVAQAVAWVKDNIEKYGGRTDQIFLMGHSAGGHLVSLLATDDQYLTAEGMTRKDIRGVICMSGVYSIPEGGVDVTFGGQAKNAFRIDSMFPLRRDSTAEGLPVPGIPANVDLFHFTFGSDVKDREKASPIHHVRPGLPPFLLFSAENDLPSLPKMAKDFHEKLQQSGCQSRYLTVPERNHNSVMFQAYRVDDPVAQEVLLFLHQELNREQ